MIKVITGIDADLTVMIGECHLGVELSMGRHIEESQNMLIIIEMTLGEEILGKQIYRGQHYRSGHRDNYRNDK